MNKRSMGLLGACALALAGVGAPTLAAVVTVYSADGLRDGRSNWFDTMFAAFTQQTGIDVQYVEAGSGVIVNRVLAERTAAQADVLVTVPPFMQVAAAAHVLQPVLLPAEEEAALGGPSAAPWYPLIQNYSCWVYDAHSLAAPPASFDALLAPRFKGRIQYSTPGQAGDGTAVMLQAFQAYGGKPGGFAFLGRLQANNLGPSSSTGRLAALVNKGEIWIANGDVQMNFAQRREYPNIRPFFPAGPDGARHAMAMPYEIALVAGAPNADAGRKLIAFLLSKPAQQRVFDLAGGFPVRRDVSASGPVAQALQHIVSGVQVWTPDWSQVAKELSVDVERWHQVTGN